MSILLQSIICCEILSLRLQYLFCFDTMKGIKGGAQSANFEQGFLPVEVLVDNTWRKENNGDSIRYRIDSLF